jgi:phosphoglycerate dehydrogenase-like enzyme
MDSLTIVALNASTHDGAFAPIRALAPGKVEVVHAQYRSSWEEVSARRTGAPLTEPEVIPDELRAALAHADVIFSFVVPRTVLELAPRLRWTHTPAAGIDHLRGTGILESEVIVTTVGGLFAPEIAEHVIAVMLHFAKRLDLFERQQRAREWHMTRVQSLANRTVGVVGVGSIGTAVAQLAQSFGMRVIGVGRSAATDRRVPGVDQLLAREELPRLLAAADYVVLAVADTSETRRMIGAGELAAMQPEAVLINVARGSVVDEPALVAALEAGRLAGAALDVFAHEPLPAESPLWDLGNVLITPHVAANVTDYLPRAITQFAANVARFVRGEPLQNRFDRHRGY